MQEYLQMFEESSDELKNIIISIGCFEVRQMKKINTNLSSKKIKKHMGWCYDPKNIKYNKEVNLKKTGKSEKLFRIDHKYDAFIVINYNSKPIIKNKGSAIFLHLTKNYKPTSGCIAINENDFLKLIKLINRKTKIKI